MNRRFSKQRQLILETVRRNPVHPTADFIYNTLKEEHPELSLGTVYRNLNLLVDMGEITKIVTPLSSERYDGNLNRHYHMVCESCNEIYDLDMAYDSNIDDEASDLTGCRILGHEVVFKCICANCEMDGMQRESV